MDLDVNNNDNDAEKENIIYHPYFDEFNCILILISIRNQTVKTHHYH